MNGLNTFECVYNFNFVSSVNDLVEPIIITHIKKNKHGKTHREIVSGKKVRAVWESNGVISAL